MNGATDELQATGPGGWGIKVRGTHVAIITAIMLAGCALGAGAYYGFKNGKTTALIEERIPQSKAEHAAIEIEVRNLRRSSNRRECIELLDANEKKTLRSNYSPYYLRTLCPWLEGSE
jgi:hypothetical protein